ncbi:MAG: hypothetical protein FJX06_16910 [Alphaproteobacteria bacterium]|nr:hypothetical protein [Alphaproteobacteria bacterium]
MIRSTLFLLVTLISAGLVGCGDGSKRAEEVPPSPATAREQLPQPAKTVSWFIEHRDELQATLKACRDNPGVLGKTPDCLNASAARDKITVQEMKDALK